MAKKKKVTRAVKPAASTAAETPAAEKKVKASPAVPSESALTPYLDQISNMSDKVWFRSAAVVMAIAAFARFFMLDFKLFHHDEGVNAFFLKNLINDGIYKYDPANYHGPTLYFISIAFSTLFGYEAIPLRASMDIFGLLMVLFILYFRRYLGNVGSLVGALFIALSPGMVYISRYFIHEILFVFLSIGVALPIVLFIQNKKAGRFAVVWMWILLLVCFIPSTLLLASYFAGDNNTIKWALRIAFFAGEAALVYYLMKMLLAWDEGRPLYLILASASAALMFATKETAFITLGTMLIALVCVWLRGYITRSKMFEKNWFNVVLGLHGFALLSALYYRDYLDEAYKWTYQHFLGPGRTQEHFVYLAIIFMIAASIAAWVMFLLDLRRSNDSTLAEPVELTWRAFLRSMGDHKNIILIAAAVVTTFVYVNVLFFTSFFTYKEGVGKAIEAYNIWTKTGNKEHTQNGWAAYLKWGMKLESPIMILSALGILIAAARAKHRFAMFTALWGLGLFLAYTIIPYKTPWLALSFFLPMGMIAGYGINELLDSKNLKLRVAAVALTVIATSVLTYQTYQFNVYRYDDDDMSYVYAHTRRGFLDLVERMNYYADKSGKGKDAQVDIMSPDYWPMTWYVKDYTKAMFHGRIVDNTPAEMIVAKKGDQDKAVIEKFSANYKLVGAYPLRPGVDLVLLVRRELADPNTQELDKIPSPPVRNMNEPY
jgi:uncharacterized protein (TIGR03663 family)